jgi:hypothetical protein
MFHASVIRFDMMRNLVKFWVSGALATADVASCGHNGSVQPVVVVALQSYGVDRARSRAASRG